MTPKVLFSFARDFLSLGPTPGMIFNALKYSSSYFTKSFRPVVNFDPLSVGLNITFRCNLDCHFCFNHAVNDPEMAKEDMTLDEVEKILDHPQLKNAFRLSFVGGEPLLHKDIFKMIELATKKKKLTMFPSNGLLVPHRIEEFKKTSLTTYQVSLYDGHLDKQIENIRLLKKANPKLSVAIARIVSSDSYTSMEKFIQIAEDIGVHEICFQNIQADEKAGIEASIFDDNEGFLDHREMLRSKYGGKFNIMFPEPLKRDIQKKFCLELYTVIFLGKGGVISPCSTINPPSVKYGTISDNNFWNSKYFKSHRGLYNSNFPFDKACEFCYESSSPGRNFI
jgi:MoaA/NifB/PqqE/SkfB family radical SAM enzyme